ncbi:hypothetical protein FB451DRAFT_1166413 [Mycena latifolia]|nr:hypothetical protein FB451DRAFT_1166413 [Mycena latifolia]
MFLLNGIYAYLERTNTMNEHPWSPNKVEHTKPIIQDRKVTATIMLREAMQYSFHWGTSPPHGSCRGLGRLPYITCVGEVFLPNGSGKEVLVGSGFMDERIPSSQNQYVPRGNGPTSWFETTLRWEGGDSGYIYLRIRRVKIKRYGVREVLEYLDSVDNPFVKFQFNFVGTKVANWNSYPYCAPSTQASIIVGRHHSGDGGIKRRHSTTYSNNDDNGNDNSGSSESRLTDSGRRFRETDNERDSGKDEPLSKRLRSGSGSPVARTTSGEDKTDTKLQHFVFRPVPFRGLNWCFAEGRPAREPASAGEKTRRDLE